MDSVHGRKWQRSVRWAAVIGLLLSLLLASILVSADVDLKTKEEEEMVVVVEYPTEEYNYRQVWPTLKFGWRIVVGSVIGFFGAAFGSVGGVGGGGIFVPVLILIIGFDAKSSTAISKCMITGMAASILYYKLKMRHPTLDMPIIDYDLALLFQPMLMLGISIGVAFNVIFPNWLVTVLLIILFLGTATKAFFKGIETWKKETVITRAVALPAFSNGGGSNIEYKLLPSVRDGDTYKEINAHEESEVPVLQNIYWKEFSLLFFVWVVFLALQISKDYTAICSTWYWVLNLVQIPVSVGVTLYEAVSLYKGTRVIASKGEQGTNWRIHQLLFYCFCGILAGIVGGLLGLGGGFILAPLFLELGIPPQVSSATATFAMAFSSSMSVVEYYLLNRFPVPYTLYFVLVATVAAFLGQHIVRRLIIVLGRASFIIFIMAFTILFSALSLGGVYLPDMIQSIQRLDHMGFDNLCKYRI